MEVTAFQSGHLLIDELNYELEIRQTITQRPMNEKRKILCRLLEKERMKPGCLIDMSSYDKPFEQECTEINFSVDSIKTLISDFEGSASDSLFKRIKSRLFHVLGRIKRVPLPSVEDEDVLRRARTFKNETYATCIQLEADLHERVQPSRAASPNLLGFGDPSSFQPIINVPAPVINVGRSINLSEWGIKFSGDGRQVFNFLERVEELALSRNVNRDELFRSAVELFTGEAFIWFRSIKDSVHDWESLVKRIKLDFLSAEVDDDLWDQIKGRKQKKNETVVIFVSHMEALFSRLSHPPHETTKVKILRKNLLANFSNQLALVDIVSVSNLVDMCRKLEANLRPVNEQSVAHVCSCSTSANAGSSPSQSRSVKSPVSNSVNNFRKNLSKNFKQNKAAHPINTQTNTSQEPSTSSVPKTPSTCWNCGQQGHLFYNCKLQSKTFCYRCGLPNVTMRNCPKCSKN